MGTPVSEEHRRKSHAKKIATLSIIILVIGTVAWYSTQFLSLKSIGREELVEYALALINSDRQLNGVQNVTLSEVDSGQRHADEMLEYHFLSHWDTKGYKPYMRYTLDGGKGAVFENCAWYYKAGGIDLFKALKELEYDMMHDDASSNWGHRDNIIYAFHNKVNIGIAYDNDELYLVQDFEEDYVLWSTLDLSNEVRMQGTILNAEQSISQVEIYFDKPTPLTSQQLSNPPYKEGYDFGSYVGFAISPPPSGYYYELPEEGIIIIAKTWNEEEQDFNITFDMSSAFAKYGKGVYTLHLMTHSGEYLTTLSIWN